MQLLALALLVLLVAAIVRRALREAQPKLRQHLLKLLFYAALVVLAGLAASGRLAWVLALIGGVAAVLARFAPVLIQLFPLLERLMGRTPPAAPGGGSGDPPRPGRTRMSRAEALQVLGLQEGAGRAEVIEAHRRLMQKLHPDRGGSDYLAAQINQARQLLLNE
jgi:hypothetical protein